MNSPATNLAGKEQIRDVENELGQLSELIATASSLAEQLERRLAAVLKPMPPAPASPSSAVPPEPTRSPLASQLRDLSRRVDAVNSHLRILERDVQL